MLHFYMCLLPNSEGAILPRLKESAIPTLTSAVPARAARLFCVLRGSLAESVPGYYVFECEDIGRCGLNMNVKPHT